MRRAQLIPMLVSLCLLATTAPAHSQASATTVCDATELEFWRSSDRIGTVASYQAYTDAYPRGRFAALAQAAIDKVIGSGSKAGLAGSALAELTRRPTSTGAVTLRVGEVYFGPGQMTVGWIGAKTQLVLPRGGWVVLSAGDHDSPHRASMRMTTLYLGRFERGQLIALMRYTFNSRPARDPRESRWDEVDACLRSAQDGGNPWSARRQSSHQCTLTGAAVTGAAASAPQWAALRAALDAIAVPLPAQASERLRLLHTDPRANYLEIERIDFGAAGAAAPRLQAWTREYTGLALLGFDRQLNLRELEPNMLNAQTDTSMLVE